MRPIRSGLGNDDQCKHGSQRQVSLALNSHESRDVPKVSEDVQRELADILLAIQVSSDGFLRSFLPAASQNLKPYTSWLSHL
jgi:hypothetical protein